MVTTEDEKEIHRPNTISIGLTIIQTEIYPKTSQYFLN